MVTSAKCNKVVDDNNYMAIIIPCDVSVGYSLVSQPGRDCLLEPACLLEFDKEIVIQCYGYAAEQFGVNATLRRIL